MVGRGWKGGDTMVVCVGAGEAQRIRTGDKGWVQPHSTPHTDTHPPKKWGKCPRLSASMDLVQPREHPPFEQGVNSCPPPPTGYWRFEPGRTGGEVVPE